MGRRDAVQVILEVVAECRRLEPRLIVSYEPGWETRGNGTSANYEGGIVHHTASASSLTRPFPTQTILRDGRVGLSGPLCNFAGPACTVDAPRLHVMSANPANHAGASGGKSMGPLPVTSLFNPRVLGLEIDYAGSVPMLAGQLRVAHVWAKAAAKVVGGGDINRVRAHAETSVTGKWDVGYANGKTYDMAAFRRDAANLTATPPDPLGEIIDMAWYRDREDFENMMNRAAMCRTPADRVSKTGGDWPYDRIANAEAHARAAAQTAAEVKAAVAKLSAPAPAAAAADAATVAAALAQDREFIAALAEATAIAMDRRARDGDPATGPVS
ncbi:hypothetical protein [Geodermatophilus chilensis]|uniref:hypothetical protein n=1 Tax=Geodermatophilus chilensis TaxID=2035835 RepID=UPI000C26B1F7|nr:hypothetical protein [Geodermatophilus chilensis]